MTNVRKSFSLEDVTLRCPACGKVPALKSISRKNNKLGYSVNCCAKDNFVSSVLQAVNNWNEHVAGTYKSQLMGLQNTMLMERQNGTDTEEGQ